MFFIRRSVDVLDHLFVLFVLVFFVFVGLHFYLKHVQRINLLYLLLLCYCLTFILLKISMFDRCFLIQNGL